MALPEDCRFPELGAPKDAALRLAVAWILEHTDPVGIVATGSIVRGEADPRSDLDIYVIHQEPWRQRCQHTFHGVPAEIFINPPEAFDLYLTEQSERPATAHMLATGFVVLDRAPLVDLLIRRARAELETAPELPPGDRRLRAYTAALLIEDAEDVMERDPENASLLLAQAVHQAALLRFRVASRFIPRHKTMLAQLDDLEPDLAACVRDFHRTAAVSRQLVAAHAIADRVLGARGFFEWDSQRFPFPDPGPRDQKAQHQRAKD